MKKIIRLFWLNLLWLICSIPLISIGTSTCAAFAVALRIVDNDEEVLTFGGISRRFFKAFRQDLIQGFFIELLTAIFAALGGYLVYLAYDSGFNLIKIAALAGYFLVTSVFILYSYPLIARYSNSFVNMLRNSVAVFFMDMKKSLRTLVFVILEGVALYFSRYICFLGFLILPVLMIYTVSLTAKDIFVKLENPLPPEAETLQAQENSTENLSEVDESSEDSEISE
ncbi:MAG: YesL family protein [Treponema sp.]|nr:YesL family protein [Treponema sp.]